MGYTTVPDKTVGDLFSEAMWDTYIRDNFNSGVPVLFADTLLGAPAANIDIASIPQTHAHLRVVAHLRSDTAATYTNAALRLNNDTAGNYDCQWITGQAAAAGATESLANTYAYLGLASGATAPATVFTSTVLDIIYYRGTAFQKTLSGQWAWKGGTVTNTLEAGIYSAFWRSASAINRITILPVAGNLITGSRVSLYGMP